MAHSDIDPRGRVSRRIGVQALVQDEMGRLLMVRRGQRWQMPGCVVHGGESFAQAGERALREATGLKISPSHLVALNQVPADEQTGAGEGLIVMCDAGVISDEDANAAAVPAESAHELVGSAWVHPDDLGQFTEPHESRFIEEALDAIGCEVSLPLLSRGERVRT
ncbi:NUDIX domain-containing protein [Streptomyces sp. 4N509B]|uniref:NUDIX domain-containing protein n=1 Tax=Streptomyces sp. 4N509B TaxID=3457413 RepID=UPI003FD4304D